MKVWKIIISILWEVRIMSKLLRGNFACLRKSKLFWFGVLAMAVYGALITLSITSIKFMVSGLHWIKCFLAIRRLSE